MIDEINAIDLDEDTNDLKRIGESLLKIAETYFPHLANLWKERLESGHINLDDAADLKWIANDIETEVVDGPNSSMEIPLNLILQIANDYREIERVGSWHFVGVDYSEYKAVLTDRSKIDGYGDIGVKVEYCPREENEFTLNVRAALREQILEMAKKQEE